MRNTGFEELSEIICKAIQDEPFFSKDILIPRIKSLIKTFRLNLSSANYSKIETPTDSAKRLRAVQKADFEKTYWQRKFKDFAGLETFISQAAELEIELKKNNFK